MADEQDSPVTDDEIAAIIKRHEAGVADLLAAYLPIEQQYMSAAQVQLPTVTVSSNTSVP